MTYPTTPHEQLPSTAEQLLLPWQSTVPPKAQLAVAVHRDFPPRAGCLAAGTGAGLAREARNVPNVGAPCGGPAAARAGGVRKQRVARDREKPKTIFFMTISFLERS